MPYENRKKIIEKIEKLRNGRRLVTICNFDKSSIPTNISELLSTSFTAQIKEPLFRTLKETKIDNKGLDVFIYTRGGDLNAVWPVACLLREFDPGFEILVPFRAHSSGTLLTLSARKIIMTPISELSPIDPSTGNQFNPVDSKGNPKGISVEDTIAFQEFIKKMFGLKTDSKMTNELRSLIQPIIKGLTDTVHPFALGNVHRVHCQIELLTKELLKFGNHKLTKNQEKYLINKLTTGFYSHLHMIGRHEAKNLLGDKHVEFASDELAELMDKLLVQYEDDFELRHTFCLSKYMGDEQEKNARFIGGAIESRDWGYLYERIVKILQFSILKPNIQVQIPPGQPMQLIKGLPREYRFEVQSDRWRHNKKPLGVTKS